MNCQGTESCTVACGWGEPALAPSQSECQQESHSPRSAARTRAVPSTGKSAGLSRLVAVPSQRSNPLTLELLGGSLGRVVGSRQAR